ncbi:MAG TPA: methyltransferase domain-containing protein [Anaerolineales bacterium]|nr:methyltransferase domain-containing protein [Anaerolineales bacterium]
MVNDEVWKLPAIVNRFLSYRGAIPLAQEQIGVMMSILKSRGQPVESFLDLGCGDGILGAAILGEYPSARSVFVDFSEPMLAQAREQFKDYAGELAFEYLDYGNPAWVTRVQAHAPFDTVVSGYSIHHQPDSRKYSIYQEIFSLLEPGGWFINIEHVSSAAQLNVDLFEDHYITARYGIEKQNGGRRTFDELAEEYKNRPDKAANILAPTELQCDWLREIGYEEVDCYFRIHELAVFAGRKPNRKS